MDLLLLVSAEQYGIARTKDTWATDVDRWTRACARTRKDARTWLAICNLAPSSLFARNPIGDPDSLTIFVTESHIIHVKRTGRFIKVRTIDIIWRINLLKAIFKKKFCKLSHDYETATIRMSKKRHEELFVWYKRKIIAVLIKIKECKYFAQ